MKLVDVLNLEKSYDTVDRQVLLTPAQKWLDSDTLHMVRALLGPLRIKSKEHPSNYVAAMTKGV